MLPYLIAKIRAKDFETEGLDPININEIELAANEERHGAVDPAEWSTNKENDDGDTEREDGSN